MGASANLKFQDKFDESDTEEVVESTLDHSFDEKDTPLENQFDPCKVQVALSWHDIRIDAMPGRGCCGMAGKKRAKEIVRCTEDEELPKLDIKRKLILTGKGFKLRSDSEKAKWMKKPNDYLFLHHLDKRSDEEIEKEANGIKPILEGVSGCVMPGQFLSIIGASGAGKTTLLNHLSGRLTTKKGCGSPYLDIRGEVKVNGEPKEKLKGLYGEFSAYVQ